MFALFGFLNLKAFVPWDNSTFVWRLFLRSSVIGKTLEVAPIHPKLALNVYLRKRMSMQHT